MSQAGINLKQLIEAVKAACADTWQRLGHRADGYGSDPVFREYIDEMQRAAGSVLDVSITEAFAAHEMLRAAWSTNESGEKSFEREAMYAAFRYLEDFIVNGNAQTAADVLSRIEYLSIAHARDTLGDDALERGLARLSVDVSFMQFRPEVRHAVAEA